MAAAVNAAGLSRLVSSGFKLPFSKTVMSKLWFIPLSAFVS
jgi:hypothetical protein